MSRHINRTPAQSRKSGKHPTNKDKIIVRVPPNLIAPDVMVVDLAYSIQANINNAGVSTASRRYNAVNAYDVDPLLGSTAMSGYAEYTGLYNAYRVVASQMRISLINAETFPVFAYVAPVNFDPGANFANYSYIVSNPLCKFRQLGPTSGGIPWSVTMKKTSAQMLGFANNLQSALVAPELYGTTAGGTVPSHPWYWQIGTHASAAHVSGVWCEIQIILTVAFSERQNPAT